MSQEYFELENLKHRMKSFSPAVSSLETLDAHVENILSGKESAGGKYRLFPLLTTAAACFLVAVMMVGEKRNRLLPANSPDMENKAQLSPLCFRYLGLKDGKGFFVSSNLQAENRESAVGELLCGRRILRLERNFAVLEDDKYGGRIILNLWEIPLHAN